MLGQGGFQVRVNPRQGVPEDGIHEIEAGADLVGHGRFGRACLAAQQDAGNLRLHLAQGLLPLAGQEVRFFERLQRL